MIAYARHYGRGAGFDDESLAVEVTRSVGIAGSFLEHDHTLRHYRDELFAPRVLLRKRRAVWAQQGSKTLEQRAEEIADELIGRQGEPALTPEQAWALQRITDGFVARMGMDT
jgi:trimethylamine--corrinoid protein Co-methyltransferase